MNFSYIFSYNNSNKKWLFYKNESDNNFKEINEKMGLWLKSLEDKTLTVEGYLLDYPISIALHKGWNLIGYPSLNTTRINEILTNYSHVFTYYNNSWLSNSKNKSNNLNSLQNFTPGFGYWIYSNDENNLRVYS